ncbi:MAG: hypothetical protein ABIG61_13355 [Planctomycetota bacterium]
MDKRQKSDTDQLQFWQMVLETFKSSGLSVRQFCKQEGLSEPSFYSWRKKLTKVDEPEDDKQKEQGSSAFIKVSMPSEKPCGLELLLLSGNTLRISTGADNKTLTNVLSALCEAGLC